METVSTSPEQKPLRDLTEIQKDYNSACAAAGDRGYRIQVLKAELLQINTKLLELNKEADVAGKAAAEVPSEQK